MRTGAVVVGAGFAGAATAFALVERGLSDVVVLERESSPGQHSSGRNAAMARQAVVEPALEALAVEGASFLARPPIGFADQPLLRQNGSLILGRAGSRPKFEAAIASLERRGIAAQLLDRRAAERRVPVVAEADFELAVFCGQDGVVDIAALLDGFLRGVRRRGGQVLADRKVVAVETSGDRVRAVITDRERIACEWVIDAAGAWAGEVAALAGGLPLPLRPCRRHLVATGAIDWADPTWPFVWHLEDGVYFRPEPPGLLLSPCDQEERAADDLGDRADIAVLLGDKLARTFPRLAAANLPILRTWAGFRTLLDDGGFAIGRDPRIAGLVWCAGLGGHGMTTAAAVGRLTAEAVLSGAELAEHAPSRFVGALGRG